MINDLKLRLSGVNSCRLGKNLESKYRHVLSCFVMKNRGKIQSDYMDLVGVDVYDYINGTGFILNFENKSIRMDITARDNNDKDNMQFIKDFMYFSIYLRDVNCVHRFDNPVLVFVVPYYDEERIITAMTEIFLTMEISVNLFIKYISKQNIYDLDQTIYAKN